MTRKLTALTLTAALLLASFASCAGDAPESPAPSDVQQTASPAGVDENVPETEEERLACAVPADLDLGGLEVRTLCFPAREGFTVAVEELNGEMLKTPCSRPTGRRRRT